MHQHLSRMTLREKVAQMVFIGFRFDDADYDRTMRLVKKEGVGGVCLYGGSVFDVPGFVNSLQRVAKLPVLVAADYENGAGQQVSGATVFPSNRAVDAAGSEELAQLKGRHVGLEARALGVRWSLSPVVGAAPAPTERLGRAAAKGLKSVGVLASAKLSPGVHPDAASMADVGAVLSASRGGLSFDGLVAADASALDGPAAPGAVAGGADVLLMPTDPDATIYALEAAATSGSLPEATLDRAVGRLLAAKEALGLFADRMSDVASVEMMVGGMAPRAAAQRLAEAAVTLVRGEGKAGGSAALLKIRDDRATGDRSVFEAELAKSVTLSDAADRCVVAVFAGAIDDAALERIRGARGRYKGVTVVLFGPPAALGRVPEEVGLVCAYGEDFFSQRAAAKALAGSIEYKGTLPPGGP